MTRGVFIVLLLIAVVAGTALYYINQGTTTLIKPPEEQLIAFASNRDGNNDIWTMKTDGSDQKNITNDATDDQQPSWSPDGKEIIMISDKINNTYQIFVSSWNGKYKNQMTSSTGSKDNPVWKHDGSEIAFISSGKVYLMNKKGGEEKQYLPPHDSPNLSSFSGESNAYSSASWSFDGKEMLYIQMQNQDKVAAVIDVSKSSAIKPVNILLAQDVDASWSPNDKRAAITYINQNNNNGLIVFNNETLNVEELIKTDLNTFGYFEPTWTLDADTILYEKWAVIDGFPDKCVGIYGIKAKGGTPYPIVEGNAKQPKISPDGTKLLYTLADDEGRRDIFMSDIDGKNAINLTNGKGDNYDPSWSPAVE